MVRGENIWKRIVNEQDGALGSKDEIWRDDNGYYVKSSDNLDSGS